MATDTAVASWLVTALFMLPVYYIVLRTHRERTTDWWAQMMEPSKLFFNVPSSLFVAWLLYTASAGAVVPVLQWTSPTPLDDDDDDTALVALSLLAATSVYVLWPAVMFVSHAPGYATLLALLQAAFSAATMALLIAERHSSDADDASSSLWPILLYIAHLVWTLYTLVVSIVAWRRRSRITPTITRYTQSHDTPKPRPVQKKKGSNGKVEIIVQG